ncbi:MAG: YfcE family phosphodiesterase [Candidatus Nezhaarchaeota archaeon]|nr:YfcE family phosphodiesterase [Candidatus Nezhaarchaeota archaeon]MCX8141628.1 YfcE family phosphodiesterase [Candidatus Nezhaarchaeota archaeon]MDW8049895.1 YfcE family phosphodiesterase [Nitrososphaerota archaeon]
MATRILILGDFHIPSRAYWIPEALELEVKKDRYDVILCTGDLTSEDVIAWLEGLGGKVYVVRGNMDYIKLPPYAIVEVERLKIGVYHGAGIHPRGDVSKLALKAKQLGVDILATGHTHYPEAVIIKEQKVVIVNPGSATGAWGGDERATLIPSFVVMNVDGRRIEIQIKEVEDSSVRVIKHEFEL